MPFGLLVCVECHLVFMSVLNVIWSSCVEVHFVCSFFKSVLLAVSLSIFSILQKPRSESVDSGMFSQPSSMEESGADGMNIAEHGADSMEGCGAGSEPLEDYTQVNDTNALLLAPPNKVI